jgi:hypothetical protein
MLKGEKMPLLVSDSWDALKERFSREPFKEGFEALKRDVKDNLPKTVTPHYTYTLGERHPEDNVRVLAGTVANAAFIHKITGKPLDEANCIRIIEGIMNRPSWVGPAAQAAYDRETDPKYHDTTADLYTAFLTMNFALTLDWAGDELPEELTRRMKEHLRGRGTDSILDNIERGTYWSTWYVSNWCTCLMMGLAVGSAYEKDADPKADEKLAEAATRTRRFLDAQGPDGGYHEGVAYAGAVIEAILASLALEHAGKPSLFDHPYFQKVGDFFLHGICPGFAGIANFSDATYPLHSMSYLGLLAKRYERPDWQWAARNVFERVASKTLWDLLWFDPNMPEEKPALEKRARLFTNTHFGFVRDSWEDDARYLAVPAGSFSFGHRHADFGSFILNEFGERQIADSGTHYYNTIHPWHVQSEAHCSLLVDGQGLPWDEAVFRTKLTVNSPDDFGAVYALIDEFRTDDTADVVVENASRAYPLTLARFYRAVVSLHGGPVLVMDDVAVKPENAGSELELRFIATESARTESNAFTISHERSECRGEVLLPEKVALSLADEKEEVTHGAFTPAKIIPIRVVHRLGEKETEARFVTLILPHLKGKLPDYGSQIASSAERVSCTITTNQREWLVEWDLESRKVSVKTK